MFKESENMDDLINEKIHMIEEERKQIRKIVDEGKDIIMTYNDAVDRIAKNYRT